MRSIEWWPLTHIQGHGITEHEYLKYRSFYGQRFYRTLIGNHTQSIEWYHFQWPWVTSDLDFKVTTFLMWNIVKTARLKDKVTIAQEEMYLRYGMVDSGRLLWRTVIVKHFHDRRVLLGIFHSCLWPPKSPGCTVRKGRQASRQPSDDSTPTVPDSYWQKWLEKNVSSGKQIARQHSFHKNLGQSEKKNNSYQLSTTSNWCTFSISFSKNLTEKVRPI